MQYTLLKLGAEWCGPCKKLAEDLKRQPITKENVVYKEYDVDDDGVGENLANEYEVFNIPALIILLDNNIIAKHVGYMTREDLDNWLNEVCK